MLEQRPSRRADWRLEQWGSFTYYLNIGKLKDALARVPELWDSFSDAVNSIPSIPSCVKERVCRIGIVAQAKIPSGAGIKE